MSQGTDVEGYCDVTRGSGIIRNLNFKRNFSSSLNLKFQNNFVQLSFLHFSQYWKPKIQSDNLWNRQLYICTSIFIALVTILIWVYLKFVINFLSQWSEQISLSTSRINVNLQKSSKSFHCCFSPYRRLSPWPPARPSSSQTSWHRCSQDSCEWSCTWQNKHIKLNYLWSGNNHEEIIRKRNLWTWYLKHAPFPVKNIFRIERRRKILKQMQFF